MLLALWLHISQPAIAKKWEIVKSEMQITAKCKIRRSGDTKPIKPELVGSTSRLGSRWEQTRKSHGNKKGEDIFSIWEQNKRRYGSKWKQEGEDMGTK